jgi:deoxyribonuclease-4
MKVGAHVSASGGLAKAFDRALAIGAETIQIYGSAPQSWRVTEHSDADVERFRARGAETGIQPVFIHGAYLVNLGTADPTLLSRSVGSLKFSLKLCSRIGAGGLIFHIGSHKGSGFEAVLGQIVDSVRAALDATPDDARLILENSAGMGGSVGSKFSELGAILRQVDSPRVKVCLDTQHSYAAGYDVASAEGLEATIEEFEREVGLDALVALHANDSKIPLAGGVDRHENIGEGQIGRDGFLTIMRHPAFRAVPFILEVPGFERKGPDKENVDILRELRREAGADP